MTEGVGEWPNTACTSSCLSTQVPIQVGSSRAGVLQYDGIAGFPSLSLVLLSFPSVLVSVCLLSSVPTGQGQTGTRVMMKQPRLLGASVPALQSVTNTYHDQQ